MIYRGSTINFPASGNIGDLKFCTLPADFADASPFATFCGIYRSGVYTYTGRVDTRDVVLTNATPSAEIVDGYEMRVQLDHVIPA